MTCREVESRVVPGGPGSRPTLLSTLLRGLSPWATYRQTARNASDLSVALISKMTALMELDTAILTYKVHAKNDSSSPTAVLCWFTGLAQLIISLHLSSHGCANRMANSANCTWTQRGPRHIECTWNVEVLLTCNDFWPFGLMAGFQRLSSKITRYRVSASHLSSTETKGNFFPLSSLNHT